MPIACIFKINGPEEVFCLRTIRLFHHFEYASLKWKVIFSADVENNLRTTSRNW